eukprot:gene11356-13420_t
MAAGASPDSLSSILSGGFSSLVEMFASSNILADYASAGVSATTAVTTSASVPNASEDEALEEVASAPEASTAEAEAETFAAVLEELASAPEASMAVPEETSAAAPATADPSSRVPPDLTSESNSNDTRPTAAKADASDVSLEEAMGSTCNSSWCSWCTDADACLDENGCAAADAQCYGECIDVQAPGVGHTCAPCPAGMVGDGVTCGTNLCYDSNGGCDPAVTCRMDAATGARLCGDCKSGEGPVDSASVPAGWVCAEVDGCAEEPCWSEGDSFQLCEDVAAPGTGRICGACPTGFAPSLSDGCVDVDECQIANGGCWVSQEDPSIRTHCRNAPGAHSCTACPEDMNGMWTWSIVNKKSGNAIDRLKSGKGLGSVFSEMAQQQKKLMDDERMGIQKRATHAASKWRKKGKSRMNTSGNSMSPDVEGPQEPQEGRASGSGGSVLQQRLRAAYKRNVLINLLSTAADLSLRPDEGRKEQERNSPSPAKTSKVLNVDSGKATVKIHAPTQKVNGWGDQSSVKSSNRAMSRPEVMSLNAPFEPGEGAIEPRGEEEVPQKQLASKGDEDLRRNADVPPFGYDPNMVLVKETITTTTTTTTREIWQPESAPGAGPVAESYEPLNQESPPATPAAAESGQRGSAWTGAWWRKSTAKKASEEMMSMLVDPVSLHKVEKARAKKPVGLTARALFNAMQINIFRLQLCIPLNYLEEQSKLQLTDKRRHKRNLNLSAQAKVDIGEELSAAADAPLLRTKSGSSGPVTEAFQDGDGGIQAAVGAEEGQEETTVYAEQQRLLRSQAAPGIGGGAQAEQPASRATSPQEETLPLCVTAPISDPAPQDSVANRRPSTKARSSWLMLRTKTELPVERMIGTAMVQAFLGIKAIMSKWDLANQARMASNAPWQMPNNRPFTWYRLLSPKSCPAVDRYLPENVLDTYHHVGISRTESFLLNVEEQMEGTLRREDHNERIKYVYSVKGPHTLERQKSLASLANMSLAEKRTYLMQQFRRSSNTAARYIKWLMKSHPLGAIYLVNATEPFSRSERILIQANTFILMLVFTVWFYYSKAVNCCKDFRVFTDCPNPFEVNEPCFGYDFCAALRQAGTEEMLPEEVFPSNFLCTAFPQGSFA